MLSCNDGRVVIVGSMVSYLVDPYGYLFYHIAM